MSREKHIEEIAEQILYNTGSYRMDAETCAEILYDQMGYRKQSDVAMEIFDSIGKILYKYDKVAERDKSEYGELIVGDIGFAIAELRKKYTEGRHDL